MSEFSERCKELLFESGSNVYRFSKHSGLDRTTLQRMVTGRRLPSQQFVVEFCANLRINPLEANKLLELYKIEKVGKSIYRSRLYIRSMIEGFAPQNEIRIPDNTLSEYSTELCSFQSENRIFSIS